MHSSKAILGTLVGMLCASQALAAPEPTAIGAQSEFVSSVAVNDNATELAHFLYSRDAMASQVKQTLSTTLPQSMNNVTDFGIFESEYPGLIAAVVSAAIPVMLKAYDDKIPLLWKNISQIYRDKFTPSELDQLAAFYKSPVGVRFINALKSSADNQKYMDAVVVSEGEVTDSIVAASKQVGIQALKKTNAQMSTADKIAIFRFENSPLGAKLLVVGPIMQKALLDWDFYFSDAQRQEFIAIRQSAISEFIAKADAQRQAANDAPK